MKKTLLYTHPLLLLFILFSICDNNNGPTIPEELNTLVLNDTLLIRYNETLINFAENLSVTFDSVYEDSRCPLDLDCFWAGNAKLGFTMLKQVQIQHLVLNTFPDYTTDSTAFGYNLKLLDVYPHRYADSIYVASDYTAKIIITKE